MHISMHTSRRGHMHIFTCSIALSRTSPFLLLLLYAHIHMKQRAHTRICHIRHDDARIFINMRTPSQWVAFSHSISAHMQRAHMHMHRHSIHVHTEPLHVHECCVDTCMSSHCMRTEAHKAQQVFTEVQTRISHSEALYRRFPQLSLI
jgi:hypothetical protein